MTCLGLYNRGTSSCSTAIIVPIELIRFDAERKKENAVQVFWISALEEAYWVMNFSAANPEQIGKSIAQIAPQQEGWAWSYTYQDEEAPAPPTLLSPSLGG